MSQKAKERLEPESKAEFKPSADPLAEPASMDGRPKPTGPAHPVMGYKKGESREFSLRSGEKLPEGWSDKPHPGDHPAEQKK